jgi:hypothetical protein
MLFLLSELQKLRFVNGNVSNSKKHQLIRTRNYFYQKINVAQAGQNQMKFGQLGKVA